MSRARLRPTAPVYRVGEKAMTHPVITQVTNRIRERSTARRARFWPASSARPIRARPAPPSPAATWPTPWPPEL
jgi:hypothetical protein